MIRLQHITKSFGTLPALRDVSLDIPPATVLGLLGENGAGKSTLMHILFGMIHPDAGTILAGDGPVTIRSPRAATALGIGMVHQHFKLVPTLTAAENFSLFLSGRQSHLRAAAIDWLARLHWQLPLDIPVEHLAVGMQQRTEIIKALLAVHENKSASTAPTLILDEPTAVLTPQESAELFAAIAAIRAGGTAVVFISHKLDEVRKICDRIAILRRGTLVHEGPIAALTSEQIAEKMIGSKLVSPILPFKDKNSKIDAAPTLILRGVTGGQLHDVSLDVYPGEILGIAGVDGNGQSHLVQAILGTLPMRHGGISIAGTGAANQSTRQRLAQIAFIAEDRQREALVLPLSVEDNLLLKDYRDHRFNTLSWLRFRAWRTHAQELMQRFDIRASSSHSTTANLSGGNQQKVVLARELHAAKPILLAVNPTRGLDVGATAFVMQQLLDARARGAAVLLIHPDLDELLAISDRVAVLYNGTLTPTAWPATPRETIGRLMLGLSATEAA